MEKITINGIDYVPTQPKSGDMRIVILQRGWIYVGIFERDGNNNCSLYNAYNIRTWGTTKGLGELVLGPTPLTKLDKCDGVIEFDWLTVIHTIRVNAEKWKV